MTTRTEDAIVRARRKYADALRAQADAIDAETDAIESSSGDERLPIERALETAGLVRERAADKPGDALKRAKRTLKRDEKNGLVTLEGPSHARVVRRSEWDRYLATPRPRLAAEGAADVAEDPRAAAMRDLAAAGERVGRRSR